ncbi:guanine nucleotide exchange factor [Cristinia sonorae]|uniref:Guanine nucleotide exchange factor n=1 Tax=Cristinia sonorae TaxID=1940300 RepID=A0A8K0UYX9_9AGAR|nr:guanine nucleotide exchange factor [Cristinia sonorae]
MSQLVDAYHSLSPSSTRSQVCDSLTNIANASPFSLNDTQRKTLIQDIIDDVDRVIESENGVSAGRLTNEDTGLALAAVKSLGKHPSGALVIATKSNLATLLRVAKALEANVEASNEALRCVANSLLLVDGARATLVTKEVGGGQAMVILLERTTNPERIFLASRILFLASVSMASAAEFITSLVETKYPEQQAAIIDIIGLRLESLTTSILAGEKLAREAMTDLLKFTFNLLLHYPKIADDSETQLNEKGKGKSKEDDRKVMGDCWNSKLDGVLVPLLRLLNTLPPTFPSPLAAPLTHVIHALITVPVTPSLRPLWFPVLSKPGSPHSTPSSKSSSPASSPRSSGHDLHTSGSRSGTPPGGSKDPKVGALDRALSKFSVNRRSPSPTSALDTLLCGHDLLDVTLSHFMPGEVDPDDPSVRDRVKGEADGTLDDLVCPLVILITKLCTSDEASRKRMRSWILPDDLDRTSPLEGRPDLLGRCLRILSCVHHPRLKDSTGEMLFAICDSDATALASYVGYGNVAGFLFNKGIMNAPPRPASGGGPMTAPNGAPIDPITGVVKEEKHEIEMTDEEKEREAERLFVLFDRLERSGALPPNQNPVRKAIAEGKMG